MTATVLNIIYRLASVKSGLLTRQGHIILDSQHGKRHYCNFGKRLRSESKRCLALLLWAWLLLPVGEGTPAAEQVPFATMLWEQRGLDVLIQIGLIFAGVLGVLGLLAEEVKAVQRKPVTAVPPQPEPVLPVQEVSPQEAHA